MKKLLILACALLPALASAQPVAPLPQNAAPLFGLPAQQGTSSNPFTNVVFTGQALGPDSCTAYSFSSAPTTGYGYNGTLLCLSVAGSNIFTVGATAVTSTQQVLGPLSVTVPTFGIAGDTDTGYGSDAANTLALFAGGTKVGTWAVPSGASATSNAFNMTLTATPVSAITNVANYQITGAGSASFTLRAINVDVLAGYTGASTTQGARFANASAGTNTSVWGGGGGNNGFQGFASGVTAGGNVGGSGTASGSSVVNMGLFMGATSATSTPALNIGGGAKALNGTINIGFAAVLTSGTPTFATSAAMVADNGALAADIFKARDNGTDVVVVTDGGNLNVINGQLQTAGNPVGYTVSAYGVGTAYTFTNTAAAVDFGTTDPAIVLDKAGTYQICGQINLAYNGATVVGETATIKVRRTNNTAADLSVVVVLDLPVSTVLTNTYMIAQVPCVFYTTALTNDAITLFGNVSAGLGAGSIDATAIGTAITAVRLY